MEMSGIFYAVSRHEGTSCDDIIKVLSCTGQSSQVARCHVYMDVYQFSILDIVWILLYRFIPSYFSSPAFVLVSCNICGMKSLLGYLLPLRVKEVWLSQMLLRERTVHSDYIRQINEK